MNKNKKVLKTAILRTLKRQKQLRKSLSISIMTAFKSAVKYGLLALAIVLFFTTEAAPVATSGFLGAAVLGVIGE